MPLAQHDEVVETFVFELLHPAFGVSVQLTRIRRISVSLAARALMKRTVHGEPPNGTIVHAPLDLRCAQKKPRAAMPGAS